MLARSIVIAVAAALSVATPALAEPAKPQDSAQPASRPIVLASADAVSKPATAADQQVPVKRPRVARVTTCRCGDPIPQDEDQQ
jgi:hypothetical protein